MQLAGCVLSWVPAWSGQQTPDQTELPRASGTYLESTERWVVMEAVDQGRRTRVHSGRGQEATAGPGTSLHPAHQACPRWHREKVPRGPSGAGSHLEGDRRPCPLALCRTWVTTPEPVGCWFCQAATGF